MTVYLVALGNTAVRHPVPPNHHPDAYDEGGERGWFLDRPDLNGVETDFVIHEETVLDAALHVQRVWPQHSIVAPSTVRSSDPMLARLLAEHYGATVIEDPAGADTDTEGDQR